MTYKTEELHALMESLVMILPKETGSNRGQNDIK